MTESLYLLFPQWQGSGRKNLLYHGARAIPGICPKLDFSTVPVPETCDLAPQNGVLGYAHILSQMKAARTLIGQASPKRILTIGGDCGTEVMPVSWLNQLHNNEFTIVWLDAHADLNTPETSPSAHFHGMPLATLLGLGDTNLCCTAFSTISSDQVILAGLRHPDPTEAPLVRKMTRISVDAMETDTQSLAAAVREKGHRHIYVHVDLDVLDPDRFPHVGCPEPHGLLPHTLIRILEGLTEEFVLIGLGVTEFTLPDGEKNGAMDCLDYVKRLINLFENSPET